MNIVRLIHPDSRVQIREYCAVLWIHPGRLSRVEIPGCGYRPAQSRDFECKSLQDGVEKKTGSLTPVSQPEDARSGHIETGKLGRIVFE